MPRVVASWGPAALIAVSFLVSRAFAYASGLRFDAQEWRLFWHFIDPVLLTERLGESLWYLHSQPPLFNAWLGLYQNLFGSSMGVAFALTFFVMGALLAQQTYRLARHAGLNPWLAAAIATVLTCSPAALLFENFLFYTYPEALLLLLCTNLAVACITRPSPLRFFALSSALSALVLLRALFHPVWMLAVLGIVLGLVGRKQLIPLAKGSALPLLLVVGVCAKNAALFGSPSLSTWRGMNLARVTVDRLPRAQRDAWVRDGTLSKLAAVGGFKPLARYQGVLPPLSPTGVPLLDRPAKSNGSVNFHHRAYIHVARALERDARTVIARAPSLYARSVLQNLEATFEPAWEYRALAPQLRHVRAYADAYRAVFGLPWFGRGGRVSGWLMIVPLLFLWTSYVLWKQRKSFDTRHAVLAFCLFHAIYVIGVGALLERSENQRFRFGVDPLLGVLVGFAIGEGLRLWTARRAQKSAPLRTSP